MKKIDAGSERMCAICKKPYTGSGHNHGVGLPLSVKNVGPVRTPRPMVGEPPGRPTP